MVFHVFIIFCLFRTSGKKGHLDENDFPYYYGNFFESGILKVTWSQLYSKFLPNNLRGTFTTSFWKTFCSWKFYGHGSTYMLILSSRHHLENISCTKTALQGTLLQNGCISIIFSFDSVFKFNIALIGILDNFRHSEVHRVHQNFDEAQWFFCGGFLPQNVVIMFLILTINF